MSTLVYGLCALTAFTWMAGMANLVRLSVLASRKVSNQVKTSG